MASARLYVGREYLLAQDVAFGYIHHVDYPKTSVFRKGDRVILLADDKSPSRRYVLLRPDDLAQYGCAAKELTSEEHVARLWKVAVPFCWASREELLHNGVPKQPEIAFKQEVLPAWLQ